MLDQWYYLAQGVPHGPVPLAQLQSWAAAGQLLPTDLVFQAGQTEWVAASGVPTLFHPPQRNPSPSFPPTAASHSPSPAVSPQAARPANTAPQANTAPPVNTVPPVLRPQLPAQAISPSPAAAEAESFSFQSSPSTTNYASVKRKSQSNVTVWSVIVTVCIVLGGIGRMMRSYENAQKLDREREEFNRAVSPRSAQDYLNSPEHRKLNDDVKKLANPPQPRRVPGDRAK